MACVCASCLENSRQLGIAGNAVSQAAIRKAYRAAAKRWHPDRFERDPLRQREAEEKFKAIHVAYVALTEHCENPLEPSRVVQAEEPIFEPAKAEAVPAATEPAMQFGGAPGCYADPDFPLAALEIIWEHVHAPDRALGMVDLGGDFSQFMLFTRVGMWVRDASRMISLLWYDHLGEVRFVDQRKGGRLPFWHRMVEQISGTEQKYALEICRSDGALFYKLGAQVDDHVKKAIYRFLNQKRNKRAVR